MPNFERNLRQTCTYWPLTGTDLYGKPAFSAPQHPDCRWEEIAELFIDKRGQEATSKSRVFLAIDIDIEGYLFLGTSAETNPLVLADAYEIRQVKKTPDLRNLKTLYVAML